MDNSSLLRSWDEFHKFEEQLIASEPVDLQWELVPSNPKLPALGYSPVHKQPRSSMNFETTIDGDGLLVRFPAGFGKIRCSSR